MLSDIAKQKILAELYTEEDYRQFAYDDATGATVKAPKGNLTLGIGWNIQVIGCPKPIAEFVAMYFVNEADAQLSKALDFYDSLDEVRKVVLCDMGFNMGVPKLLEFHDTLNYVKRGNYHAASVDMLNSEWARQVGKRAIRLSKMMDSGQWT